MMIVEFECASSRPDEPVWWARMYDRRLGPRRPWISTPGEIWPLFLQMVLDPAFNPDDPRLNGKILRRPDGSVALGDAGVRRDGEFLAVLDYTAEEWAQFESDVRAGRYDYSTSTEAQGGSTP